MSKTEYQKVGERIPYYRPKVDDVVRLRAPALGRYKIGTVVRINGAYILVKMNYKGILMEMYPNELQLIKRK